MRPVELGRALGGFVRALSRLDDGAARTRLTDAGLDAWAVDNLLAYLAEQREATGHLPDDRTIVVERFRDELGDWRLAVHSPFGAQVHQPWALAVAAQARERLGVDAQVMHTEVDEPGLASLAEQRDIEHGEELREDRHDVDAHPTSVPAAQFRPFGTGRPARPGDPVAVLERGVGLADALGPAVVVAHSTGARV